MATEYNLPADRMIRVEEILVNVDDMMIAERFDETPMFRTEGTRYNKGLQITFRDGKYRRINTEMSVLEFEIERAKKFTPVAPESSEHAVWADEDGWTVESVSTQWSYLDTYTGDWVKAQHLTEAVEKSRKQSSRHRAEMTRTISQEWVTHGG